MLRTQQLVHDMMEALELPLPNEGRPSIEGLDRLSFDLLRDIVKEEAKEFDQWMDNLAYLYGVKRTGGALHEDEVLGVWAQVIDAMCDIIVVVHNTSNAMGIDLEPFFDEVHRTNMAKVGGGKRADGKAMKPTGWRPPQIKRMLAELLFAPQKPLTLQETMKLLGAEPAPMPPGAAAMLSLLGVPRESRRAHCCQLSCGRPPIFGILRDGASPEMHYHSCKEHVAEFLEDEAAGWTVWRLSDEERGG